MIRVLRVFRFFRLVSAFQSLNKLVASSSQDLLIWLTMAPFTKVVALYESILEVSWVGVLAVLILYMVGCIMTTAVGGDEHLNAVMPKETEVISAP